MSRGGAGRFRLYTTILFKNITDFLIKNEEFEKKNHSYRRLYLLTMRFYLENRKNHHFYEIGKTFEELGFFEYSFKFYLNYYFGKTNKYGPFFNVYREVEIAKSFSGILRIGHKINKKVEMIEVYEHKYSNFKNIYGNINLYDFFLSSSPLILEEKIDYLFISYFQDHENLSESFEDLNHETDTNIIKENDFGLAKIVNYLENDFEIYRKEEEIDKGIEFLNEKFEIMLKICEHVVLEEDILRCYDLSIFPKINDCKNQESRKKLFEVVMKVNLLLDIQRFSILFTKEDFNIC